MSYVLAFLGFAALIILHEAGHFTAAKAVGMRVERFSLFFGPMLVKFRRGETEYGIGPIPLGGYVKITGMNPNEEIPDEARPRAYYNQPVWKRVVVIAAGPAVNIFIAFAIIWALILSQGQNVLVHGQPVPPSRSPRCCPRARPKGSSSRGTRWSRWTGSAARSPRCAGRSTATAVSAPRWRAAPPPIPLQVVVRRDGQLQRLTITPRYNAADKRIEIGFAFATLIHYPGVFAAASSAASGLVSTSGRTVSTVVRVFEPQDRKQLHGVVGGYEATQSSFSQSTALALEVLALISLSLGVINLFPFLPLDGGHIFWAVAEKVRGRRIPFAVMERASVLGFVLILLLFFIGLSNDISTLSSGGTFGVR